MATKTWRDFFGILTEKEGQEILDGLEKSGQRK